MSADHTSTSTTPQGSTSASSATNVADDIAAIRADLDRLVPPLVEALKRDQYFTELREQVRRAEHVSRAWRDWPLITGIHDAVLNLRQSAQPDRHLLEHLESLIFQAGVTEYGLVGERIDPEEAEITAATGAGPRLIVSVTRRPGLRIGPVPLRKPIVEITRQGGTTQ